MIAAIIAATFTIEAGVVGIAGFELDTSNRTVLWEFGFNQFAGYELFGTGLGSFWTTERAALFQSQEGWVLENFHNGYLSTLFEVGLVGITLLGLVLIFSGRSFFKALDISRDGYSVARFLCFPLSATTI